MSNALAIAAVTSTIRYLLEQALGGPQPGPVGGAQVTTLRPDELGGPDDLAEPFKGINVYLHRVTPNHAWNLADLPTRRSDGQLSRRPVAALDLHYLISCAGDGAALDAQRLLGRAVLALATTPVLSREVIAAAADAYSTEVATAFLADADLADQVEAVKLAPAPMGVEEVSRLWATLGGPHLLSLTYTATVVLLEADVTPRVALPVRQRSVVVEPLAPPRIAEVGTDPPHGPVEQGTVLHVRGSGLTGPGASVRVGTASLTPQDGATPEHLAVVVTDAVPAGIRAVQVVHTDASRVLARSNGVPALVRPRVAVDAVTATVVRLQVRPALRPGQRATVTLTGDQVLRFDLDRLAPDDPPTQVVELARADIDDGDWLVRITVDGAESLPQLEGDTYTQPRLSLP